ncbi:MAG: hypothetical protein JNL48_06540 [Acidobacteria bacterium]|nr:hypothetical protein [Acidobacteriota bacterium]
MKARSTWHTAVVATMVAVTSTACAFVSPSAPTPLPPPAGLSMPEAPAPTTVATGRAALEVASVELRFIRSFVGRNDILYVYEPEITLRETRGQSYATIESMFVTGERLGVFAFPASACMGTGWHVRPGASTAPTLHLACDVSTPEYLVGTIVRFTVIYRDDRGDVGQVTATSTITGSARGAR